ncbi:glyoxylase-like metal-dependent hydrolase (beta-lactamase superfamily II) [Rheinheimera pacifica]|uniref:MBL fold metallo-hydrolase n=1 Tax=Rheinheimera pacifica TaxID=173990 RepID=UPI00216827E8|nr:MBL fold metallo-hydrolase [Rheinheimera pacifica]MCS4306622.1 glyoxylase-like metal-dependent hydrolase (beta-lactamase superfamily II) [Rheinheimera pacifica]
MKFILIFIALTYPLSGFADTADISVTKRSADAYILTPAYSTNIGVFNTAKGVVLIDPMPGENQLEALSALVKSIFGKQVTYILNTHDHSDHSGGNAYFIAAGSEFIQSAAAFADFDTVTVKSHTANDTIFVHKPSNTLFVGDIYTTNWHPTFYAGGVAGFVAAVDAILNLGDENSLIVPGHGEPSDKQQLKLFRQNTLQWVAQVKVLREQGLTVSEIKDNAEIQHILRTFNPEHKTDFIPQPAVERFIERTLTVIKKGV